jgi:hypothetical protein
MIPRDVKAPTIPIAFHRLLKVVAIVDAANPQTKQLLDQIAAQNFEIEIGHSYERDVSEDAAVGAYIALIDGERLERRATWRARYAPTDFTFRCGGLPILIASPIWPFSGLPARSTATFIWASRPPPFTRSKSSPAS